MSIKIVLDLDDSSLTKLDKSIDSSAQEAAKIYSRLENKITETLNSSTKKVTEESSKRVNGLGRNVESFGERVFKIANQIAAVGLGFDKGLFGDIKRLSALSVILDGLGSAIGKIDNDVARFLSNALNKLSFAAGSISLLSLSILGIGASFGKKVSSNIVAGLKEISDEALRTGQSFDVLNNFIENYQDVTNGAVGTTKSWSDEIENLATTLNITRSDLNKSAQEIVAVASQYGFAETELQKLLTISAEYAKVNKKELFPTTLAIVNALTGNAQAAQALGIKLNEASVSAFALKKGLSENFSSLSDNEKATIRYNKLLDQYSNINGIAAGVAGSLADQQNAVTVSTEKLSTAFGKGIARIENIRIVSAAYAKIAGSLNETLVEASGAIAALGARFLQIVSSVVLLTVKLFTAVKVFTVLKGLFTGGTTAVALFNAKIPILNVSLSQLITRLTAGSASGIGFARGIDRATLSVKNFALASNLFSGSGTLIARLFTSVKFVVLSFAGALKSVLLAFSPILIIFAKVAAVIGVVVGVFVVIRDAITALEKRTKAFSLAYTAVANELSRAATFFQPAIDVFERFRQVVVRLAQQGFGLLVLAISKVFSLISEIVIRNPFGVFSNDTVAAFARIQASLDGFNQQLVANNFILEDTNERAKRSIASVAETIKQSNEEAVKSTKKTNDQISNILLNGIVQTTSFALEKIGASLRQGSGAFSNFGGTILSIIGDVAIQIGQTLIKIGIGIDALRASLATLSGGVAIAAGVGLIALGGFLKSFGPGLAGAGTGGAGGAFGPAETLTRPNDELLEDEKEERKKQDSRVTLNVQGSIFDTKETGTQIAKILSDSFGSQGVVLTDARFA